MEGLIVCKTQSIDTGGSSTATHQNGASFVMKTDAIAIAKLVSLSEAAKSRTGKARRQTGHIRVC